MTLEIIKKYKIRAKKSLWQNFLINEEILKNISEIVEIKNKNIIEVWPWYWALTEKILQKNPKNLTLIELDLEMIKILNSRILNNDFENPEKLQIKNIDVLKYFSDFEKYSVIANIPYYITSPIIRHFLYKNKNIPEKMLILMQKDVWDKIILWQENTKKQKSSVLSLFVAKKCFASEVIFVWKNNFSPAPKVESSVILFEPRDDFDFLDDDIFIDFIKKSFKEPRKKLVNNLAKSWYDKEFVKNILKNKNISENIRPEDLNISIWCDLILDFNKKNI